MKNTNKENQEVGSVYKILVWVNPAQGEQARQKRINMSTTRKTQNEEIVYDIQR